MKDFIGPNVPCVYPFHREYICFVNTCVRPRNTDLEPRLLEDILLARNSKTFKLKNFKHRLVLVIRRSVLEMGYIGPQDLVPPNKSNQYTGALCTLNIRFTPNLIIRLVYKL